MSCWWHQPFQCCVQLLMRITALCDGVPHLEETNVHIWYHYCCKWKSNLIPIFSLNQNKRFYFDSPIVVQSVVSVAAWKISDWCLNVSSLLPNHGGITVTVGLCAEIEEGVGLCSAETVCSDNNQWWNQYFYTWLPPHSLWLLVTKQTPPRNN